MRRLDVRIRFAGRNDAGSMGGTRDATQAAAEETEGHGRHRRLADHRHAHPADRDEAILVRLLAGPGRKQVHRGDRPERGRPRRRGDDPQRWPSSQPNLRHTDRRGIRGDPASALLQEAVAGGAAEGGEVARRLPRSDLGLPADQRPGADRRRHARGLRAIPARGPEAAEELAVPVPEQQEGGRAAQRQHGHQVVGGPPGGVRAGQSERREEVRPGRRLRGPPALGEPLASVHLDQGFRPQDPPIQRRGADLAAGSPGAEVARHDGRPGHRQGLPLVLGGARAR
ncbi:hypothetical protein BSF38_04939 [Paludisphaera borealis]|uniref:Uncharacterized protein n=1 Tax=Paludisphaera borealis TaxID=1387353 RepID=A0A1U7CWW3_9BACT|nr:hypothetical protein BSF38_04939 [Paludisphaera borealis]